MMMKCLLKAAGRAAVLGGLTLMLALFLGGCENPASGDGDGSSVQKLAADEFRAVWDNVLEKKVQRVSLSDEADVDETLEAWEALGDETKAELAAEKTALDNLKAKIQTLKSSIAAWRVYLEGKPDNSAYTPWLVAYTGRETPAAIYNAIAAAGKYVRLDLSGSAVTGFEYDEEPGRALVIHLALPDSLEEIEDTVAAVPAFGGFPNLKSVSASGLRRVGSYAFYNCAGIETVTLDAATDIGQYAFNGCTSLATVNLPKAEALGTYAFYGCTGLITINLPEVVTIDDSLVFAYCSNLTTANMPKLESLGNTAFRFCDSLTTVNLPKVVSIGTYVFQSCTNLTTVDLSEAEVTIGNVAFHNCSSLAAISLPKAVAIGSEVFYGCTSLITVTLGETPPTVDTLIFGAIATTAKTITIKVPNVSAYTATGTPWNDKIGANNTVGNYWDNTASTRDNLTVALAAIGG
jgi:hypothetical protein